MGDIIIDRAMLVDALMDAYHVAGPIDGRRAWVTFSPRSGESRVIGDETQGYVNWIDVPLDAFLVDRSQVCTWGETEGDEKAARDFFAANLAMVVAVGGDDWDDSSPFYYEVEYI